MTADNFKKKVHAEQLNLETPEKRQVLLLLFEKKIVMSYSEDSKKKLK